MGTESQGAATGSTPPEQAAVTSEAPQVRDARYPDMIGNGGNSDGNGGGGNGGGGGWNPPPHDDRSFTHAGVNYYIKTTNDWATDERHGPGMAYVSRNLFEGDKATGGQLIGKTSSLYNPETHQVIENSYGTGRKFGAGSTGHPNNRPTRPGYFQTMFNIYAPK